MALRPIVPGLRQMVNPSHDVAKVSLVIPAGAEVTVPDGVAAQLERQGLRVVVSPVDTKAVAADAEQIVEAVKASKKAKG